MNLKEAFRFQNKLQALLDEAQEILSSERNVTVTESTYYRHKVMSEAEDETVTSVPETEYAGQITEIVKFMVYLISEREKLFAAIREAKNALPIDMDSQVSLNAARQRAASVLMYLNDLKASEQLVPNGGTGYRFNAEGNQVSYLCDVRHVRTINYDRKVVKRELERLNKASDEMSAKLDLCLVTSEVSYEVPFDVNVTFAEAFELFSGK